MIGFSSTSLTSRTDYRETQLPAEKTLYTMMKRGMVKRQLRWTQMIKLAVFPPLQNANPMNPDHHNWIRAGLIY